jgi:hypothetical protein
MWYTIFNQKTKGVRKMKTINFIKLAIATISIALVTGCANTRPADVNNSGYHEAQTVPASHRLSNAVAVEADGFVGTSKFMMSGRTASNLDNNTAKKAVESSLDSAGMLASNEAKALYKLFVTHVEDDTMTGNEVFTTRNNWAGLVITITLNYQLVDNATGTTIYNSDTTSEGVHDKWRGNIFANWYELQRQSVERSYQDNFRQLIEDLRQL